MAYRDSYLVIYHGPRRGGKTLSMVFQAIVDMIKGIKVYSNFPIIFNIFDEKYESQPLNYYEFLAEDPKYQRSTIVWDETAFWAFNRSAQSVFNKFLSLGLILIGKQELNMYLATQFISMLEKNVRLQADAHIMCTDLSFLYPHLKRGTTISHLMKDISGRFTGRTFEMTEQIFQRTFHGEPFWHCYSTKQAFDIFEAQQKIKVSDISHGVEEKDSYSESDANDMALLQHVIAEFVAAGKTSVSRAEFWDKAGWAGVGLSQFRGDRLLRNLEVELSRDSGRPRYVLPESPGGVLADVR
jgi:hypothetical protein